MATKLGDINVDLRLQIAGLRKDVDRANKTLAGMNKGFKRVEKSSRGAVQGMVRLTRQAESLYVMYRTLGTVIDKLVVAGVRLNQQYEDQSLGIAGLISSKIKLYDANNKEITGYAKFAETQKMTSGIMDDIKKAALETPASFQQMVGFYQQAIGHAISSTKSFGANMKEVSKNTIEFTKGMSALGAAAGMSMDRIDEEIRSLMSGNAGADSLLAKLLFGSPGAANKAVKEASRAVGGLSDLLLGKLKAFEQVRSVDTFTKALAQAKAMISDIQRQSTQPLFEDLKGLLQDFKTTGLENAEKIIRTIQEQIGIASVTLSVIWDTVSDIGGVIGSLVGDIMDAGEAFNVWNHILAMANAALMQIANLVRLISIGIRGIMLGLVKVKQAMPDSVYRNREFGDQRSKLASQTRNENRLLRQQERLQEALKSGDQQRIAAAKKGVEYAKQRLDQSEKAIDVQAARNRDKQLELKLTKQISRDWEKSMESFEKSGKMLSDPNSAPLVKKIAESQLRIAERSGAAAIKRAKSEEQATAAIQKALAESKGNLDVQARLGEVYRQQLETINQTADAGEKYRVEMQGAAQAAKKAGGGGGGGGKSSAADHAKITKELEKQANLRKRINELSGGVYAKSLAYRLKVAQDEWKAAEKAAKAMKLIIKDSKSRLQYEKAVSLALEKQVKYLEAAQEATSKWSDIFSNIFSGDFSSALDGIFGDMIKGLGTKVTTMLTGIGATMSSMVGGFVTAGLSFLTDLIGKMLSSLFQGKKLTEAEITAAQGITSPESTSVEDLLAHMDWTLTRGLKYSKGMYDNLRALVAASGRAALGMANLDFNPPDYYTQGFLGFSSKTVTNLAAGLELLGTSYEELQKGLLHGRMYETNRVQKSKWWGLSRKEYIKTKYTEMDPRVGESINEAYRYGLAAVSNAFEMLGRSDLERLIPTFKARTHKLNFRGKSQDEIAAMITGAIGSDLAAFIKDVMPEMEKFQQNGEDLLMTLGRVTYELEVTQDAFFQLGGSMDMAGKWALDVSQMFVQASGGLDAMLSNVGQYIDAFYSDAEKQALRLRTMQEQGGFVPLDRDEYKRKIERLTERAGAGSIKAAEKLAELLRLSAVYDEYFKYLENMDDQIKEAADKGREIQQQNLDAELKWQNERYSFYQDIEQRIMSAYTGTLSYLNSIEQASWLEKSAMSALERGDTQTYFDTLAKQLELEKKMSTSREEYAVQFDSYIEELKTAEPEKTTDDVVETLEQLIEQNKKIEDAITMASYQKPL